MKLLPTEKEINKKKEQKKILLNELEEELKKKCGNRFYNYLILEYKRFEPDRYNISYFPFFLVECNCGNIEEIYLYEVIVADFFEKPFIRIIKPFLG